MKKLLLLMLALSLSLAQMVRADNDNKKKHKRQAEATRSSQSAGPSGQAVRQPVQRRVAPAQRSITRTPLQRQAQRNTAVSQRKTERGSRSVAPARTQRAQSEAQLEGRNHGGTTVANQGNNRNRNVDRSRNGNASVQRNRGDRPRRDFNRNSFSVARSHVIRTHHNRNWWRSHYNTTFVLFGGGYYYWWNNYWYPAYGYSPYYNNYLYSEPIYGYNDLDPGQVIENVQLALRDEGYYPGAIDGLVGPQTRAALSAYQRDHGLVITSAVDEPTLVTLGLA